MNAIRLGQRHVDARLRERDCRFACSPAGSAMLRFSTHGGVKSWLVSR